MPEELSVQQAVESQPQPAAEHPIDAAAETTPHEQPEQQQERAAETAHEQPSTTASAQDQQTTAPSVASGVSATPTQKDQVTREVEGILSDGLQQFYSTLSPEGKVQFRQKGEQISGEIVTMVRSVGVQVKRVLELIYSWLKIIPGVNKFFLEQEAKIKTDRIIQYVDELRKRPEHEAPE
jgi:hypothetical protein